MATKTRISELKPCRCSIFAFGEYGEDGSAESYTDYTTECTRQTNRLFAQGHDAKLVGFLVRAELSGEEISITEGGVRITFSGAVKAAAHISGALANKAQGQLDAARRRLANKAVDLALKEAKKGKSAERKLAEKAKVVAPAPTTRQARIKVGRWEYDAMIEIATGRATHDRKLGGTRTVEPGEYKEV